MPDDALPRFAPTQTIGGVIPVLDVAPYLGGDTGVLQRLGRELRYAFEHGYRLAMMVAEAGSQSQRNAERKGFRIAYTRTKWRL